MRRKEDLRLLTGNSCFADDLHRLGSVRACILRSPHAHARIRSIGTARALSGRGILDVVTAADVPAGTARIPMRMYARPGMERLLQPVLAEGIVRYVGEPVAVVVTDSAYAAEDALELIDVDYEPLEPVLDVEQAAGSDGPLLHPNAGSNIAARLEDRDGDVDEQFAAADLVIEERLRLPSPRFGAARAARAVR